MKKIFFTVFLFAVMFSLLFAFSPIFAQSSKKTLKYLPKNEAIDEVSREYNPPMVKHGIDCEAAFNDAYKCQLCVNTLKPQCPDCCLKFSPQRAVRCTPEDSNIYQCNNLAFSTDSCSAVANCKCPSTAEQCSAILYNCGTDCPDASGNMTCASIPHCQQKGCPDTKPLPSTGKNCIERNNNWICEENNLQPEFKGCPTSVSMTGCPVTNYYTINPITDCTGLSSPPPNNCYEYIPLPEYQTCISNCCKYGDDWERCTKRTYCCNQNVCGAGGFPANCTANSCVERVNWPECDALTLPICTQLWQDALACLTNPSPTSACARCFEEIDSAVSYTFVARSRESLTIFWQVLATPEVIGTANLGNLPTYFFTMVKISDSRGNEVHRSIIHQKSFQGTFSIFSATSAEVDNDHLKQGETYTARLYYFLPARLNIPGYTNVILRAKIQRAELIIMRTRN